VLNRWAAVAPSERSGGWEGRLSLLSGCDNKTETKTDECGHLHRSSSEAMRCSQQAADRLNHEFLLSRAVPAQRVPSDYYLG
jgi:hypothetical protein